jgi:hypothetical protein
MVVFVYYEFIWASACFISFLCTYLLCRHATPPSGVLVLMEFVVMSLVYYYAFGYKVITESTASHKTASGENLDDKKRSARCVASLSL